MEDKVQAALQSIEQALEGQMIRVAESHRRLQEVKRSDPYNPAQLRNRAWDFREVRAAASRAAKLASIASQLSSIS